VTLTSHNRREWLRARYRDAQARDVSLFSVIDGESARIDQLTRTGQVAVSTSGNGRSVSFDNKFSPQNIQEMCSLANDAYDDAIVALGIDRPAAADDAHDADIFAAMMADARFSTIKGATANFMYLAK
jgi:hypothetical protein